MAKSCPGPLSAPGKTWRIIANRLGSVNRTIPAFLLLLILGTGLAEAGRDRHFGPYREREAVEILVKAYADCQGDRTERLVVLAEDGQVFTFGGKTENYFSVTLNEIIRELARKELSIWQITDIFHNHNNPKDVFSVADKAAWESLRKAGIKAGFHIFYPETRRIKTFDPR